MQVGICSKLALTSNTRVMESNTAAVPDQPPHGSAFQISELQREEGGHCQSFTYGETEAETGDMHLLSAEITAGLGGPMQGCISAARASTLPQDRSYLQHPVQQFDFPGLLLGLEKGEALWGADFADLLRNMLNKRMLHQGVVFLRVQALGNQ